MDFDEALKQVSHAERPTILGTFLEEVGEVQREKILRALRSEMTSADICRVLNVMGLKISDASVRDYRARLRQQS